MEEVVLFVSGVLIGSFGTIVGVGGGFIIVPLLIFGFHLEPRFAVGTSMVIVAFNALSGTSAYIRQRRIDYSTGILFSAATLPGSLFGALLLQSVSKKAFDISFGLLLLVISLSLGFSRFVRDDQEVLKEYHAPNYNKMLGVAVSIAVGFIASMAGIGGGVIHVPAMLYLFHFPPFIAIPTSHFILAISATVAAASHLWFGEVQWDFIPYLGIGTVIGAQIGGTISHKVNSTWIVRALMVLIGMVAVRFIVQSFW